MSGLVMVMRSGVALHNAISHALMQCPALPHSVLFNVAQQNVMLPHTALTLHIKLYQCITLRDIRTVHSTSSSTPHGQVSLLMQPNCRYEASILYSLPMAPSMAQPQCNPNPSVTCTQSASAIQCFKARCTRGPSIPFHAHPPTGTLKSGKRCWRPGCDR